MIKKEIKVQQYGYDDKTREFVEPKYLSYNVDYQVPQFPLAVSGYDSVLQVVREEKLYDGNSTKMPVPIRPPNMTYYISIDPDKKEVIYHNSQGDTRTFPLMIPAKLQDSASMSTVTQDDLTFDVGDDTLGMRIFLQSLTIPNPRYQS
jgi:hypothetical protein